MQNRYFAYFSDFSHIGVDFRILICEFAYAWRPWQRVYMPVSNEDKTGMAIRYVSINTEHHILMVPI